MEQEPKSGFTPVEEDYARVDDLRQRIARINKYRDAKDPVEAGLLRRLEPELAEGGLVRPHMADIYAHRRTAGRYFPNGYDQRSLEFSIDIQLRQKFPNDYPHRFLTEGAFRRYGAIESLDFNQLIEDGFEDLRSTIPVGYWIFSAMSQGYRDVLGDDATLLDTGTGAGVALKKLMMAKTYPYKPISIVEAPGRGQPVTPNLPTDEEYQEKVNELLARGHNIARAVGYDALRLFTGNPHVRDLVYSHTYPMSESLRDPVGAAELLKLMDEHPANVSFIPANIDATDPENLTRLPEFLPNGVADLLTFSATYFETKPESRANYFANFRPYSSETAKCFVSDFASVSPAHPNGLRVVKGSWWQRLGQFATFEIDLSSEARPPVELARFLNRRGEVAWLTKAGKALVDRAFELD